MAPLIPYRGKVLGRVCGATVILKEVFLDDKVGHRPQLEEPDETMACFFAFHKDIGIVQSKTCNNLNVKPQ
jgi:hypothetical protein